MSQVNDEHQRVSKDQNKRQVKTSEVDKTSEPDEMSQVNVANNNIMRTKSRKRAERPISLLPLLVESTEKRSSNFSSVIISQKSIDEIMKMAEGSDFPKREFYIEETQEKPKYTAILNFFESKSVFKTKSEFENHKTFYCRFCGKLMEAHFPYFTNFNRHLMETCHKSKPLFLRWKNLYDKRLTKKTEITAEKLVLIKLLCSSNMPLSIIRNPFFQIMAFSYMGEYPVYYNLRHTLLPKVTNILYNN